MEILEKLGEYSAENLENIVITLRHGQWTVAPQRWLVSIEANGARGSSDKRIESPEDLDAAIQDALESLTWHLIHNARLVNENHERITSAAAKLQKCGGGS